MKLMIPVVETKRYAVCPCCQMHTSTIDHMLGKDTTTYWYCDNCGERYKIQFRKNGEVYTEPMGERTEKHLVLLRNGDIGLVVEGMSFSGSDPEEHHEYYYNEHTCPTNYMRNVVAVIDLKHQDQDPHGIFEYVATLDYDEKVEDCNHDYSEIMKQFGELK